MNNARIFKTAAMRAERDREDWDYKQSMRPQVLRRTQMVLGIDAPYPFMRMQQALLAQGRLTEYMSDMDRKIAIQIRVADKNFR